MDALSLLHCRYDGAIPKAEREAALRSVGEIINPLVQATSRARAARAARDDAKFAAKMLIKMRSERGRYTPGARKDMRERLQQALVNYRAWKAEAERILLGMAGCAPRPER